MLKIKKIFKPILVFILLIPMAIIFCACGDNKKDDKLTNTSNVESSEKTENNENTVTFPVKEFKNILTAINYANKICKNYSFIANGTGSFDSNSSIVSVREKFYTKVYNSYTSNKFISEIDIFKNSSLSANLGFLFQRSDNNNSLLFAESLSADEKNLKVNFVDDNVNGAIYYYDITNLEGYAKDNSYLPGDLPVVISSESIGKVITNLTKIDDKYYCKTQLNYNSAKKYIDFLKPYLENNNITMSFKSCTAEIYLDKYSRYDQIKYDLVVSIDASAYSVIGAKFDANISFLEKYSNYANVPDINLVV